MLLTHILYYRYLYILLLYKERHENFFTLITDKYANKKKFHSYNNFPQIYIVKPHVMILLYPSFAFASSIFAKIWAP